MKNGQIWLRNRSKQGTVQWRKAILLALLILTLGCVGIQGADYPEEGTIRIWAEGNCRFETLKVYQIGTEYDPIREEMNWLLELVEGKNLEEQLKDETKIPETISLLERKVKKEKPYIELSLQKDAPLEFTVPSGVYLIVQDKPVQRIVQSSLLFLPYMNEEGNQWISCREVHLKSAPIPVDSKNPNTGDSFSIAASLIGMLFGLLGVGVLWKVNQRRE